MTTPRKFYLPSAGTPDVSPTPHSGWGVIGSAQLRPMSSTLTGTPATSVPVAETSASIIDILLAQFVSEPSCAAKTISGTFSLVCALRESGIGQADMYQQARLSVWSSDGMTHRGDLYSGQTVNVVSATTSDPNAELNFSATHTRILVDILMNPVAAEAGDRIVFEHGVRSCNTSATSRNAQAVYRDNAASDFALMDSLTTNLNPWIELSDDPFAPQPAGWGLLLAA